MKLALHGLPGVRVPVSHCQTKCAPLTDLSHRDAVEARQDQSVKRLACRTRKHFEKMIKADPGKGMAALLDAKSSVVPTEDPLDLPSDLKRLVTLDQFMKDKAQPFYKSTGLMFVSRGHKEERIAACRLCPKLVSDKDGIHQACGICTCRLGRIVDDPNEPDPHRRLGKLLGRKGDTADAVRIANKAWYAAARCPDNGNDRWLEIDRKYLSSDHLEIRDRLYEKSD